MVRNGKECKRNLRSEVQSRDFSSNIDISAEIPLPNRHAQHRVSRNQSIPQPVPTANATSQVHRGGTCGGSGRWCDTLTFANTSVLFLKIMCTVISAKGEAWSEGGGYTVFSYLQWRRWKASGLSSSWCLRCCEAPHTRRCGQADGLARGVPIKPSSTP